MLKIYDAASTASVTQFRLHSHYPGAIKSSGMLLQQSVIVILKMCNYESSGVK